MLFGNSAATSFGRGGVGRIDRIRKSMKDCWRDEN